MTSCDCSGGPCDSNDICDCARDLWDNPCAMRYNKHGRLTDFGNDRAIYECNDNCNCEESCLNHVVGRGRKVPIDVFMTKNKGWGRVSSLL